MKTKLWYLPQTYHTSSKRSPQHPLYKYMLSLPHIYNTPYNYESSPLHYKCEILQSPPYKNMGFSHTILLVVSTNPPHHP